MRNKKSGVTNIKVPEIELNDIVNNKTAIIQIINRLNETEKEKGLLTKKIEQTQKDIPSLTLRIILSVVSIVDCIIIGIAINLITDANKPSMLPVVLLIIGIILMFSEVAAKIWYVKIDNCWKK